MTNSVLQSSGKVLVLEDPQEPIYKSLSFDHKVLENIQGLCILQTVRYVWYSQRHVTSINSTEHEDTLKNVLLTDVKYYLLIYVSK